MTNGFFGDFYVPKENMWEGTRWNAAAKCFETGTPTVPDSFCVWSLLTNAVIRHPTPFLEYGAEMAQLNVDPDEGANNTVQVAVSELVWDNVHRAGSMVSVSDIALRGRRLVMCVSVFRS